MIVAGTLVACAALAGLAAAAISSGMGTAMDAGMGAGMAMEGHPVPPPWTIADIAVGFAMWTAMMTAMMLPSAAPMTTMFSRLVRRQADTGSAATRTGLFVGGYLAAWSGVALAAAVVQQLLSSGGLLLGDSLGTGLAGAVLVGAGVYQLTPAKQACLRRCRTPLGFLLNEWRDGAFGSAVMGLRHGMWCAGCCVGLMAVLFVVGVMSLGWMAALAVIVLVEKTVPWGAAIARLAGSGLIAFGVWSIVPLVWR
ncbi:MAG: DUF2182 domain-containing protein [Actinomycetota bacterium]|nr:DUF2182 domain-containing protein [Actinomycetota bacterium]